jgi:predicted transcriptional regulator
MSLVEDYMNTKMVTRNSKTNVLDVSKAMTDWKISSIAITDDDNTRVIGILTERDIVNSIAKGVHPDKIIAGSLMSTPIYSVRNDQMIEEAARLMIKKKVRHLLVEDACHGVVGIITATDLARYLKRTTESAKRTDEEGTSDFISEVWELFF